MSSTKMSTVPFYRHPDVASSSLFHKSTAAMEAVDVPVVLLKDVLEEVAPNILLRGYRRRGARVVRSCRKPRQCRQHCH